MKRKKEIDIMKDNLKGYLSLANKYEKLYREHCKEIYITIADKYRQVAKKCDNNIKIFFEY